MSVTIEWTGWSLIPGPRQFGEPLYSTALEEIVGYLPKSLARAILTFPGTTLRHPPEPTWWEWAATWEQGGRMIEIGMTVFDEGDGVWGGSPLRASCEAADLLGLWLAVRSSHSAVWLHSPDCRVYTPASFAAEHAT
jgi:hypothetical protein